jgi:hypothetical protein
MIILKKNDKVHKIDALHTMYPSFMFRFSNRDKVELPSFQWSTLYGYAAAPTDIFLSQRLAPYHIEAGNFFSIPVKHNQITKIDSDMMFGIFRLGFNGQMMTGEVEYKGRLTYIDGCSDSILAYPPRKGDPSLNYLYFPANVNQTYHTHPSIRMGIVLGGSGLASTISNAEPIAKWSSFVQKAVPPLDIAPQEINSPLDEGDIFFLEENELHRFKTLNSAMKIIAYHPESDFGPTDEDHAMINRTYLKK